MDLERIKQNLRLRSGRSKKTRKQPVAQPNAGPHAIQPEQKNIPRGSVQEPAKPTTQPASGAGELSVLDVNAEVEVRQTASSGAANVAKHRPRLPHASTGSNLKPPAKSKPGRFGQSGIDRPRLDSAEEPALIRTMSENDSGVAQLNNDSLDFDLRPPPPRRPRGPSVESLSESLFSSGHLNVLLRDPHYLARFTSFLTKYRPQYHPVLLRYLETQKAIKAVEYANAVAEGITLSSYTDERESSVPRASVAATLDKVFEQSSTAAFRLMVDSALPMYITYNLVKLVTECFIGEITGRQAPLMRDLVGGLSGVFCLSDPKQEDNPVIYASEEFYRYTGYGPDDVIGRNCRFLQGPRTKKESVARLRETISKGEGICETLLNYRRDGRPFINLLMIAPLHDDKGNVKYYIGAQVDVTGLVARGKGLDGFERYHINNEMKRREMESRGGDTEGDRGFRKPKALAKLRELSEMFDLEESAVVRSHSRSASASGDDDQRSIGSSRKGGRRVLGESDTSSGNDDDDEAVEGEDKTWKLGQSGRSGLSGKLPGVYESFMLVRAAPPLRIVFVSPNLRRRFGSVVQHPFLSHVAASTNTLKGLKESFGNTVPVLAKINFLLEACNLPDGTAIRPGSRLEDAGRGRICWISATPMLGSDDKTGVWMIVVVERTKVPVKPKQETLVRSNENQMPLLRAIANKARPSQKTTTTSSQQQYQSASAGRAHEPEDTPVKLRRLEDVAESVHNSEPFVERADEGHVDEAAKWSENQSNQQVSPEHNMHSEQEGGEDFDNIASEHAGPSPHEPSEDAEDDFARMQALLPVSEGLIHADAERPSGMGPSRHSSMAVEDARKHPEPGSNLSSARVAGESLEGDGLQHDATALQDLSDDEGTVTNHRNGQASDGIPSPSRLGTNGVDTAPGKGKNYMDYLRHPGSRPSAEYNRTVSGSFLSARYCSKEEEEEDDGGEDFNDSECVRSPYSVD